MNGVISTDGRSPADLLDQVRQAPSMEGLNLADQVTTATPYQWSSPCAVGFDQRLKQRAAEPFRVVAIDFGIKRAILDRLVAHGCAVTVVPADANLDMVLSHQPEGVFLSNGPGDPAATAAYAGPEIASLIDASMPIFGICIGHQLMALAMGAKTHKMERGHRGA